MPKRALFAITVAAVAALAACAPKYKVIAKEADSPVLSGNCDVQLLDAAPTNRGYFVIGEVQAEDPNKLAENAGQFLDSVRESVCRKTANAIIVNRDATGRYVSGTVIRLR